MDSVPFFIWYEVSTQRFFLPADRSDCLGN